MTDLVWESVGGTDRDRTFLLIHCGLGDRSFWDLAVPGLSALGRVLTYDQRGFGQSPDPAGSWAPAEDAVGVLDAAGVERAVVIGCSFGSRSALDLAVGWPERVERVVLVSGPGEDDEGLEQAWERVDDLVEQGDFDAANEIEIDLWAERASEDVRTWAREQNRVLLERQSVLEDEPVFLEPEATKRLDEVRAPALVLLGEHDQPSTIRGARKVGEGVADGRIVEIADAGHLLGREQPAAFVAAVRAFAE